uniref:Uncharacterized protein n=1 Tax=Leersia perrieri TaxID=77586 RepID=A0A0D9WW88_9ORYZ
MGFVSVVHLNGSFYAACYDGTVLRVAIPLPSSASPPRADKFADGPSRNRMSLVLGESGPFIHRRMIMFQLLKLQLTLQLQQIRVQGKDIRGVF